VEVGDENGSVGRQRQRLLVVSWCCLCLFGFGAVSHALFKGRHIPGIIGVCLLCDNDSNVVRWEVKLMLLGVFVIG
jgi:hypothetical protein